LEDREAEVQLMDWDRCVNKQVAGAYRRAGGEKEYGKAYREKNAETIKARDKSRYQANAEKIKAQKKAYYEENADTIKAKKKEKCTCFCGGEYTHSNKARHLRTKRHMNFVEIISMV